MVVDDETSARSIMLGQNLLAFFAALFIATIFYFIRTDVETATVCLTILFFAGFYLLWRKGEKITVPFDKAFRAESSGYSIFAPLPTICLGDENGVNLPVDSISITVKQEDIADLWKFDEKESADSGFCCSVSDPTFCLNVVGKVEESDFLKREEAEWKMIDEGLCGGVCGGGHAGIDE